MPPFCREIYVAVGLQAALVTQHWVTVVFRRNGGLSGLGGAGIVRGQVLTSNAGASH